MADIRIEEAYGEHAQMVYQFLMRLCGAQDLAKDLLPLYADGLCCEETAKEMEAHLETCAACAEQLQHYRTSLASSKPETAADAEIKPMKKAYTPQMALDYAGKLSGAGARGGGRTLLW